MDWNDELIAKLRVLWGEGHSTSEIGRRIGMSKNAVVGKAHRLNLAPRPSPIRREGMPGVISRPPLPKRCIGPTLPPLAAVAAESPLLPAGPRAAGESAMPPAAPATSGPPVAAAPAPPPLPVVRPDPPVKVVPQRSSRSIACCWPIGEPGTKSFRFCDAEAAQGKPYCAEHAAVAYVKIRDRREEAA